MTVTVTALKKQGFDHSARTGSGYIKVKCSQCEAFFINRIATHEHGCPNQKRKKR